MPRTYEITKGQQYDQGGALVEHSGLYASYTATGSFDLGQPVPEADADEVAAAVARVVSTGQSEVLTLGGERPSRQTTPESADCPHYTSDQGCPLHGELCSPEYR